MWNRLDEVMVGFMRRHGIRLLRFALGIVFVWFGALKLTGYSPVVSLIAHAIPWLPPERSVPLLGVWETAVGLGLLFGVALRVVLFLFWILLASTFSVLVLRPDIAFQGGNPFLLTVEGEFVVKNLVLIAAGLVVGSTVPRE